MIESIRPLLYPLGLLANLLFTSRFLIQWIQSEKLGRSTVTKNFWRLSFLAHVFMFIHGFIQLQYPICLIQALNACIAWRNLDLINRKERPLRMTLLFMLSTVVTVTLLFFLQGTDEWMSAPTLPWTSSHTDRVSLLWHLFGFFGMLLFASRYWIQWWFAEKQQESFLGKEFWWISCIGALLSLSYAIRLVDPVQILGFSIGLIPYIRNLMLMNKVSVNPQSSSLFLFAGEQSGDILGGNLVRALKQHSPSLNVYGVGGPEMKKSGMSITHPMERFQVMGFSAVFKALPRLWIDFRKIKNEILSKRPAGVVLIDYPDFNMRLAKTLRKNGYTGKVIHYVCPSVWAWRKKRVHSLAKTLDHLLSVLPFEENCFSKTTLPVTYVGHPLISTIDTYAYDPHWKMEKPVIALFPGSRRHEIELNLPLQLAAARQFGPSYKLAVSVARPELQKLIQKYTDDTVTLVPCSQRYELMKAAQGALATSGTIILELGLHSVPTVVTYQLAGLNYLLGRYAFRILLPFYSLVNIICDKEVYPEFIHKHLSADAIFHSLKQQVDHPEHCRQECARLRTLLQNRDASTEAAKIITQSLS